MRGPIRWLSRALREDDGLTAVEYAVLAGLVLGAAAIAAYSLGQGVHRSSNRVSWASASSGTVHGSHVSGDSAHVAATSPTASGQSSNLKWALLSLGISAVGIGGFVGWYYLHDVLRQQRTRRIVRRSLSGPQGQAALQRLVRKTSREPFVRKTVDTRLIGRNGPEIHKWVQPQQVSVSGDLVSTKGPLVGPETDAQIIARLRPTVSLHASTPAPLPAMPVAR